MNNKNRKCPMKWRNFKDPQLSFSMQRVEKGLDQRARGETYRFAERRQWSGVSFWHYWVQEIYVSVSTNWELFFLSHESAAWVEDFRTVRWVFIHDTAIAEFLNETVFPLNIGVWNIANFIRMKAIPTLVFLKRWTISCQRGLWQRE